MGDIMPRSAALRQAMGRSEQPERSEPPAADMLTVAESCTYLRISKWTLYRLIQDKQLKSVKIGRRRLIPMRAILEFVKNLEAEAA
jgi:excisionase family DNA binding protein